jgi:hypothetical protein
VASLESPSIAEAVEHALLLSIGAIVKAVPRSSQSHAPFGTDRRRESAGRATMSYGNINDPKHWRARAAEMHALAETMKDAETIGVMRRLADDYEKLANRAEARSNGGCRGRNIGVCRRAEYKCTWERRACVLC